MKVAILSHKDVADWYTATLMERGYEVIISGGGAIHAPGLKPYLECDGCLLLGDEPDLLEIADYMEASGKKIWRELSDIPIAHPRNSNKEYITSSNVKEEDIAEQKRINCVGLVLLRPAAGGLFLNIIIAAQRLKAHTIHKAMLSSGRKNWRPSIRSVGFNGSPETHAA
jgi:hypothetical protein